MTRPSVGQSPPQQQGDVAHDHDIQDVVAHELIPRLLMLDLGAPDAHPFGRLGSHIPSHESLEHTNALAHQLALLTLEARLPDCEQYLQKLRDGGLGLESIFLEVLQPAARILGSRWKEDSCSFVDVTTGLWQLQQLFHRLLHDFQTEPRQPGTPMATPDGQPRPSAFFCTPAGAQHRLGVQMISAFFCRAGWQTGLSFGETTGHICDEAKRYAPDLLGVSLSCEQEMIEAPAFILALKQATTKTNPIIMIGGPGPSLFPELAAACQADLVSGDAPEALAAAQIHIQRRRDQAGAQVK
ncbi:MAG: cobalamin B12-binding domain-containing protein [Burkholderiaceae bacterium]